MWKVRTFFDRRFGFDCFVSYSRAEGTLYADALVSRLTRRGFRSFLDTRNFVAGDSLDDATRLDLRRSRILVLVGTPAAVSSIHVRREVEFYKTLRANAFQERRIVPVDVGGALDSAPNEAWLQDALGDRIRLVEPVDALRAGPSSKVVAAIERALRHTPYERRWRNVVRAVRVAGAVLLLLAAALVGRLVWLRLPAGQLHLVRAELGRLDERLTDDRDRAYLSLAFARACNFDAALRVGSGVEGGDRLVIVAGLARAASSLQPEASAAVLASLLSWLEEYDAWARTIPASVVAEIAGGLDDADLAAPLLERIETMPRGSPKTGQL